MLPFGLGDTGISKGSGKPGDNIMLPFGLGDTGISRGSTEEKKNIASNVESVGEGLVSTKNLAQGSDIIVTPSNISGGSKKVDIVEAPASNWLNRSTGGLVGGDLSLSGLPVYGRETGSGLLYRLPTPRGSAMDKGTFFRVAKKSKQHVNIKPTPKKVSSFYRVTNEQIIPQTIGKDFFKFKVGSTNVLTSVASPMVKLNKINMGLNNGIKTSKGAASTIKLPKLRSIDNSTLNRSVEMSANVNSIMKKMSVKKPKVK
jgi:hypothetical protein